MKIIMLILISIIISTSIYSEDFIHPPDLFENNYNNNFDTYKTLEAGFLLGNIPHLGIFLGYNITTNSEIRANILLYQEDISSDSKFKKLYSLNFSYLYRIFKSNISEFYTILGFSILKQKEIHTVSSLGIGFKFYILDSFNFFLELQSNIYTNKFLDDENIFLMIIPDLGFSVYF